MIPQISKEQALCGVIKFESRTRSEDGRKDCAGGQLALGECIQNWDAYFQADRKLGNMSSIPHI
jgi:hypothetical protein